MSSLNLLNLNLEDLLKFLDVKILKSLLGILIIHVLIISEKIVRRVRLYSNKDRGETSKIPRISSNKIQ